MINLEEPPQIIIPALVQAAEAGTSASEPQATAKETTPN